jgi:hypothetical protein
MDAHGTELPQSRNANIAGINLQNGNNSIAMSVGKPRSSPTVLARVNEVIE